MAKKIIISYSANPTATDILKYKIFLSGVIIPYSNGNTEVVIDYGTIVIGSSLISTLDITVDYLRTNYVYNKITYQRIGNNIEITINYDNVNVTFEGNIPYSVETIPTEVINLKYFIQYKNKVNDDYFLGIYGKNFQGVATEVHGKIKIEKGSIKDNLDTISGTGLSIDLEADENLTFEDLYTDNEQDYMVRLYKNSKVVFVGFLKPDGIFQSFTRNQWVISLDCVDGLGALENLSFVKDNGLQFTEGRLTALEIIYYCLRRTGILLNINTSINIYYDGLTLTDELDILSKIKMNSDRFIKVDDNTIMSCDEVLKSILDIFCACITQEDGEWYIFRPNELYANQIVKFKRYDLDNNYTNLVTKNLTKNIGSQIDNFYPHHCNSNQIIKINGGISAYRLGYKYGYVSGLLPNQSLNHDVSLNYDGWTVIDNSLLINDPTSEKGIIIKDRTTFTSDPDMITDAVSVTEGDIVSLSLGVDLRLSSGLPGGKFLRFQIKCGSYYLYYNPRNNETPLDDAANAEWRLTSSTYTISVYGNANVSVQLPPMPVDGLLTIGLIPPTPWLTGNGLSIFNKINLIPSVNSRSQIGEFHTSSRSSKISSIIKENKTVYNGDNEGAVYLGAIYKEGGSLPTSTWFRKGFYESKPLLQIAAEEQLRIAQKPLKEFSGDLYGYLPYLCVLGINNINGKFMLLEYSYDTIENITSIKALELYSAEISDLIYKFTYDYGNTVKPTITG